MKFTNVKHSLKRTFIAIPVLVLFFLMQSITASAQQTVTGTVKSDTGDLLPGVSIVVKGTTTGVTTNVDGEYSISVPGAQAVLVFSFVGMQTQEVPVDGRSVVDVTMVDIFHRCG